LMTYRITKDSTYRPILHVAWVQPRLGTGGLSAPVHIQGSEGKLNGYLQMQHDQGLQMTVDLELTSAGDGVSKASAPADAPYLRPVGKTVVYRLNEKRSVKLNEVYYLDHPKFGVIAKISLL